MKKSIAEILALPYVVIYQTAAGSWFGRSDMIIKSLGYGTDHLYIYPVANFNHNTGDTTWADCEPICIPYHRIYSFTNVH